MRSSSGRLTAMAAVSGVLLGLADAGSVWYATSPDGRKWTEQGPVVKPGPEDAWDGHGVFTPNILVAEGKYGSSD